MNKIKTPKSLLFFFIFSLIVLLSCLTLFVCQIIYSFKIVNFTTLSFLFIACLCLCITSVAAIKEYKKNVKRA